MALYITVLDTTAYEHMGSLSLSHHVPFSSRVVTVGYAHPIGDMDGVASGRPRHRETAQACAQGLL